MAENAAEKIVTAPIKKKKRIFKGKTKDLIFYISMMIWPTVQFLVFYVYVNFNSLMLSFQKIDVVAGTRIFTFDTIKEQIKLAISPQMIHVLGMSMFSYLVNLPITTVLGLFFSYYIYKNCPGGQFFRVVLFLPSLLSSIVTVTMFQFFVDRAVPAIYKAITGGKVLQGLFASKRTQLWTLIFYGCWLAYGTSVLLYSNNMSRIPQELIESANLDGATGVKEFWYICMPQIYPTFSSLFVMGVSGLFNGALDLFPFFGQDAPPDLQTYGYWFYIKTLQAQAESEYPPIAALGMLMTCIILPLTFIVRWAMDKFGPSED